MDRIKAKLADLSAERDNLTTENDTYKATVKKLEQEIMSKDQEIQSLTNKNNNLEGDITKLEEQLKTAKAEALEGAQHGTTSDALQRKVSILEEELEKVEGQLKETGEKLRLTDIKAEHFERKVSALEGEREQWEKKYEDATEKHRVAKKELDELAASLEGI